MKTIKKFTILAATALFLFTASCSNNKGDENPCADADYITQVATAYSNASQAYTNDASTENCTTLKSAGKDYIDLLKSMLDCAPASELQELREDITEAEAVLNSAC